MIKSVHLYHLTFFGASTLSSILENHENAMTAVAPLYSTMLTSGLLFLVSGCTLGASTRHTVRITFSGMNNS